MMIHTLNLYCCNNHEEILMKLSELTTAIAGVSAQLTKAQDEILAKIAALEEAADAIEALRSQTQALDDIVPDVIPE